MNSFVASAGPSLSASQIEGTIANDGFFPDIDLADIRNTMRLDGTVPLERLAHAARAAMLDTNTELAAWRAERRAEGATRLGDVPAERIDDVSALVFYYRRAVFHFVYADVTEKYRAFDLTKSGMQAADELTPTIDESRRTARWSISAILGESRCTIELI